MSKRYLKGTIPMVENEFPKEQAERIITRMHEHLERMIKENADDPKAFQSHSYGQIYPLIAFDLAFQEEGMSKEESYDWLMEHMMQMCDGLTKPIKKILKLGLWRIVPHLFNTMTDRMFGPDCGFESRKIESTKMKSRFDMTRCPYYEKFKEYGCPELCRICCASDDRTYGDLHPNLEWKRSKTLARGGDCCDFEMSRRK